MGGKLKRKYENETIRFNKSLKKPLDELEKIIKWSIGAENFMSLFKIYYPYEWEMIVSRQNYYTLKQKLLDKRKSNSKNRYNTNTPEEYFKSIPKVKSCISKLNKKPNKNSIDLNQYEQEFNIFKNKREQKINKRKNKLKQNNRNLQKIDPLYIDIYIGLYERKSNIENIDLKREILEDLIKYDGVKVNNFLYKINDTEVNYELQKIAFYELQKRGKYVKLMKKGKKGKTNKRKLSTIDKTSDIEWRPNTLFNKISSEKQQNLKSYDYFISHSYKDNELVREYINNLNKNKKSCYCDWMSDRDFLKRELTSKYTMEVLKHRIKQSNALIYLKSNNSINSKWVNFELKYAKKLNKNIKTIEI